MDGGGYARLSYVRAHSRIVFLSTFPNTRIIGLSGGSHWSNTSAKKLADFVHNLPGSSENGPMLSSKISQELGNVRRI